MEAAAAQFLGAGLAMLGAIGPGIGIGLLGMGALQGIARNPDAAGAYTWWSNRAGVRERNVGWRIDYFFISSDLLDRVVDTRIHAEVMGSDHCPISLELAL